MSIPNTLACDPRGIDATRVPDRHSVKPAPFAHHAPRSLNEALELLGRFDDDAKALAGGQSLIPVLAMRLSRFDHLVDLAAVPELAGVGLGSDGVRVGAMTTQTAVFRSPEAAAVPVLAMATRHVGHAQIRNRGTVGGSLAHADPAAEYPAVALALDAVLEVAGPDRTRRIPAAEFFRSTWTTALEQGELLVAAEFPAWGSGFAVREIARRHGDFAMAGVVCALEVQAGRVERAALALFGVGSTPLRAPDAERALTGRSVDELTGGREPAAGIGALAAADLDPPEDLHASGPQRRRMAAELVRLAIGDAVRNAIGEDRA
jgi:carbon-monoxide dehydrogenase medium subunit